MTASELSTEFGALASWDCNINSKYNIYFRYVELWLLSANRSQLGTEGEPPATQWANPDHVTVAKTEGRLNDELHWLYGAANPATNRLLNVRLYSVRIRPLLRIVFEEFPEERLVVDVPSLIDGPPWLEAACDGRELRFQYESDENRNSAKYVQIEVQ